MKDLGIRTDITPHNFWKSYAILLFITVVLVAVIIRLGKE